MEAPPPDRARRRSRDALLAPRDRGDGGRCSRSRTSPSTSGSARARSAGPRAIVRAVDDISFTLDAGTTLGLVGESGCGKTTTSKLILGLERPTGGAIRFDGQDVLALDAEGRRRYRRAVQAVFQDPYASLDPRMRVAPSWRSRS